MRDPLSARTRLGGWWAARGWANRVKPEDFASDPITSMDELQEHVIGVLFDSRESPDPGCLLCIEAERRGVWADYGFDEPFGPAEDAQ